MQRGRFLSLQAAAALTPMGPDWLASEIRSGRGPAHYLFGTRFWFFPEDIEAWIASKRTAAGIGKASVCSKLCIGVEV